MKISSHPGHRIQIEVVIAFAFMLLAVVALFVGLGWKRMTAPVPGEPEIRVEAK